MSVKQISVPSFHLNGESKKIAVLLLFSLTLFLIVMALVYGFGFHNYFVVIVLISFFLVLFFKPTYRIPALVPATALSAAEIGVNIGHLSMGHIVIIMLMLFFAIDLSLNSKLQLKYDTVFTVLILMNLYNLSSYFKAITPRYWMYLCADFMNSSLICLAVITFIKTPQDMNRIFFAILLTGLMVALIGIGQFIFGGIVRVYSIIGDGQFNTFAGYLMLIIPISLSGLFCYKKFSHKTFYFILSLILIVCLFMTQSRGGVSALLFVLLVFLGITYRGAIYKIFPALLCLFLGCILGWVLLSNFFPSLTKLIELRIKSVGIRDMAMWTRLQLFYSALNMFKRHPLFGIGFGNFVFSYHKFGTIGVIPHLWSSAHNIYLMVLGEQGLIGFALFCGAILYAMRGLWIAYSRSFSERIRWWSLGLLGSITSFLIHGFVDSIFHFRPFSFLLWLIIGLSCSIKYIIPKLDHSSDSNPFLNPGTL